MCYAGSMEPALEPLRVTSLPPAGGQRMYAMSFKHAYEDIRVVLLRHGFEWQQGSVYFGNAAVTPVFAGSVRDIRMLQIEENNDLRPAI
jgi:virulence-associated protein VapD